MDTESEEYKVLNAVGTIVFVSLLGLMIIGANYVHWSISLGCALFFYFPITIGIGKIFLNHQKKKGKK